MKNNIPSHIDPDCGMQPAIRVDQLQISFEIRTSSARQNGQAGTDYQTNLQV